MNPCRLTIAALTVAFLLIAVPNSAFAQAAGGRQGNQGNRQRGANANADPAQARERALTRIKDQLGASDDEWKVLQPKVDKLLTTQQDARGGGGGGGRSGRRGGQQASRRPRPRRRSLRSPKPPPSCEPRWPISPSPPKNSPES